MTGIGHDTQGTILDTALIPSVSITSNSSASVNGSAARPGQRCFP